MTKPVKHLYQFGPFHLDATERVLYKNGQEIILTPKMYEVLLVLIQNSGHIVERDALMQKVWPNSFVEEHNITQQISELRKILSEGGDNHPYIETIPKRGYRFTATVKEIVEEAEGPADNNGQWVLVISATIKDIDKPIAEAIEAHLRKLSKDVTLTLVRIEAGSVILILEGTRAGFERISKLVESGQLNELLGFDIKDVRWGLSSEIVKVEPQHRAKSYLEDLSPQEDTGFPTQAALALKQSAFDNLLLLLDVDPEQAGIRYEKIRKKLLKFFELRGAEHPEDLADETFNRVARKIEQVIETLPDLDRYFYGVARNIYLEYSRGRHSITALQMPGVGKAEDDKRKRECFEKCLLRLPVDKRELLLMYYESSASKKIMNRKNLATQHGISLISLRAQVMKIRREVEKCISDCIERSS